MSVWSIIVLPDTATFCSALQYWIRGSRVLYTICIHWHFMGSQVAHCATAEKAINGLSISLWTNSILQDRKGVCPTCSSAAHGIYEQTQFCRFTQGENVVKMLLTRQFCSRMDQEARQTWKGGVAAPTQLTPKCHEGGGIISMKTQPQ